MGRVSLKAMRDRPGGAQESYRTLAGHEAKAEKQQYLTPAEEKAVVEFLSHMAALGHPVKIKHIPSIARSAAQHRSPPNRPTKPPGKNWARAFGKRNPRLQAKRVRPLDWHRHEKNTYQKILEWFQVIEDVVQSTNVHAENLYNMDEIGVMLSMPASIKVLVGKSDSRDYRGAHIKRETATAIVCISADGRCLSPMIIWSAATYRINWTNFPTPGWHYACSESGYTNAHISLEWLTRVFDPQTKERAGASPRVLICDGFGTHETLEVLDSSHDIAVFAPLKAAYRDQVERLERAGVNAIGKAHFTRLYSPARELAFSKDNILAGWSKVGLFPFNPDRVLQHLHVPSCPSVAAKVLSKDSSTDAQDLRTPLTPVSVEALMSLQNIIVQHDAGALDCNSKHNLERHLDKLTKAASAFHTTNTLQKDETQFLHQMNSENKTRRTTKSVVLGKGRVMSYEDLVTARARRADQDNRYRNKARGSRCRNHECQALNAEAFHRDEEEDNVNLLMGSVEIAAETSCTAPVARLWDATTGQEQHTLKGHSYSVRSVVFSTDGKQVASASDDSTVRLWDATTGQEQHTLKGHPSGVCSVIFSHDGKQAASASFDSTVRFWDATTGQEQHTLKGHSFPVHTVAFSPNGKQVASASADNTVRLWDAMTGQEQHILKGNSYSVRSVVFSPDGKQVASGSFDSTVCLWDVTSGTEVSRIDDWEAVKTLNTFPSWEPSSHISSSKTLPNVSSDSKWLVQAGRRSLWIPSAFRPGQFASTSECAVLGSGSGRITFLFLHRTSKS